MPARKIPMNHLVVTGKSVGRNRMVAFEGDLEPDFYLCLRFDPDVKDFEEQPVTLRYTAPNGRQYNYTPDVRITYHSARPAALIEIKPMQSLVKDAAKLEPKFAEARRYAEARGEVFEVRTELDIRTPCLYNLRFLEVYDRLNPSEAQVAAVLEAVRSIADATPSAVLESIADTPEQRDRIVPILWHLVIHRRILVDLDVPLTMSSALSLSGGQV
jgi:hypothetical protein